MARVIGKGRPERALPFGRKTAVALDRYLRIRSRHAHAASPWLWLGQKGPLTATGLAQMLWRRGRQAGIEGLHAHQLRHTFAHAWLARGGLETDLMRIAGWRSRHQLPPTPAATTKAAMAGERRRHDAARQLARSEHSGTANGTANARMRGVRGRRANVGPPAHGGRHPPGEGWSAYGGED